MFHKTIYDSSDIASAVDELIDKVTDELKVEIADLEDQLEKLQADYNELEAHRDDLQHQVDKLEERLEEFESACPL
ncbi:MAG: hypothetical protein B7X50_08020 [Alishewanella sp. 34-51-39]|nr:MAG: hypothetical protein B7X50_08020 [Alishewanella sp. 34-51-39]